MTTSWRKMRSMLDSELLLKRMGLEERTPTE